EELAEISHMLDEQAGRRRRSSPTGLMRIMVDGIEGCRVNPVEESGVSFCADEDAQIIEVKTMDQHGELLLATHLLSSLEKGAHVSSIRLEGGQELSLSIMRRAIEANEQAELLVKFNYRETHPRRAVRLWWRMRRSSEGQRFSILWGSTKARYIF